MVQTLRLILIGTAIKREGIHLEFLARLFEQLPAKGMSEWVNREPSGQYARRAGFFYEWLTGNSIDFPGVTVGNYVAALPETDYLVASKAVNAPRWRVRNNLPGTSSYCPLVRRTSKICALESYDFKAQLNELETEFGTDVILRSAVWLTIKESRASFQIEHEELQTNRIQRFASVIEKWSGHGENPLDTDFLTQLQNEILGERALRSGVRRSPVFIGEFGLTGEVVHYVAPHWNQIAGLLEGLKAFAGLTEGRASILRAAVLSFGFVYIHPMADGNGRISRFLINDILRRDGEVPEPFILPVSSTITRNVTNRAAYDRALERFSKPLMERFGIAYSFGPEFTCEDGVRTNFQFLAYTAALPAWAFPDLTLQAEYLGQVIEETIRTEMRQEANFLWELRQTREKVKEIVEGPDIEIDRIIRSVRQNQGHISGKLINEFPILEDEATSQAVIAAILGPSTSPLIED